MVAAFSYSEKYNNHHHTPKSSYPMASFEEELLQDAAEDARIVEYIKTHLPSELQEKITEDELYYFLDLIVDYYAESGVLDATPDKDGFVEIDTEAIANHLSAKAAKEGVGKFSPEDLLFVVQAELDYGLEQEES